MARNMITGIETQKMQEYTQEQIESNSIGNARDGKIAKSWTV